ncbi:CCA tRNA nucleotidyltransferase, mitochondrial, partial [Cladochytrium tenue]
MLDAYRRVGPVVLTDREAQICDLLVAVADKLNASRPNHPALTLRIAGGWVRDKARLLGDDCHDIDVALDSMMGFEFATHVNEYLVQDGLDAGTVSKIDCNPDRSKHLETATTKVLGQPVDFVNLRTETYQENSRIPSMEFGTPEEDARRRDITVNSLFYNLHTREVEDLTGLGLADLRAGHVRTPIDPLQTFVDDPLRVLRVIRFASRFGFSVDPAILRACADPAIHAAFNAKVSRERVGIEVDKMLLGPDPLRALLLIAEFGFFTDVFAPPPPATLAGDAPPIDPQAAQDAALGLATALHLVLRADGSGGAGFSALAQDLLPARMLPLTDTDKKLLFLAAVVYPFRNQTYHEKKKFYPSGKHIVMVSLKLGAVESDWACALAKAADDYSVMSLRFSPPTSAFPAPAVAAATTASPTLSSSLPPPDRLTLGMLVRTAGTRP